MAAGADARWPALRGGLLALLAALLFGASTPLVQLRRRRGQLPPRCCTRALPCRRDAATRRRQQTGYANDATAGADRARRAVIGGRLA
jgi:hypothetical protein